MDKIFGETKHKIGDIVLVENTQFRYVGVVVDIMLSWDGYPMYSVYSIDSKDWCGVFTDAYVQPYTLPYESIGRYGKIGEELNHFDDVKVENRLKDIADGKASAEIDKDYAQKLITYIARWKQCCITSIRLYEEVEKRAERNESTRANQV